MKRPEQERKKQWDGISPDEKVKISTPEKLIESKKKAKLHKMTSRFGVSPNRKGQDEGESKEHNGKIRG
jgi:hypothetical protein